MSGVSEHSAHVHNESGATELVCVSVFGYIRSRGEMFLAEAQSGIRRLSLPRTSLTLFCLFFGSSEPSKSQCCFIGNCCEAITGCCPAPIRSLRQQDPMPLRGQGSNGYTTQGQGRGTEREELQLQTGNCQTSEKWRIKVRQLPLFSFIDWRGMYSNIRQRFREDPCRRRK